MNVENFEMLTCPPSGIRISIHSNSKKNEDVFRLSLGKQNSQPEGKEMDFKPAYKITNSYNYISGHPTFTNITTTLKNIARY